MDGTDVKRFIELFFSAAMAIIRVKDPDYNPDGIPLLDVLEASVEYNVTPPQTLLILCRKHQSAINRYARDGRVQSEPILERLKDVANYMALIAFYDVHKTDLHTQWKRYWRAQACACVGDQGLIHPTDDMCQRCRTLSWLERQAFVLGSLSPSSGSTPKAQG